MRLIVSGGWFGKEGLYEVEVLRVSTFTGLPTPPEENSFLLLSYDLTSQTLGVPVKSSDLPPALIIKTGELRRLREPKRESPSLKPKGCSLHREEYLSRVEKVKSYIERGDIYQLNLTSRFDFEFTGSPEDLFIRFFQRQPVPFAFYLDAGDFFLLSGSMELFLERRGSLLRSKPIKGTGREPAQILMSEKERAENLMITDMMRNDIGKIALKGSVRVSELFGIESYKTLCHMHSTVEGQTHSDLRTILEATFPPASVTGAPKRRAVQIIDELEPHARGYYCGTAGFVWKGGDFTLSVLIRTAFGGGSDISYFSGCGIVWDSKPEREWEELLLKQKAFYP